MRVCGRNQLAYRCRRLAVSGFIRTRFRSPAALVWSGAQARVATWTPFVCGIPRQLRGLACRIRGSQRELTPSPRRSLLPKEYYKQTKKKKNHIVQGGFDGQMLAEGSSGSRPRMETPHLVFTSPFPGRRKGRGSTGWGACLVSPDASRGRGTGCLRPSIRHATGCPGMLSAGGPARGLRSPCRTR